jgi:hypothetical protein
MDQDILLPIDIISLIVAIFYYFDGQWILVGSILHMQNEKGKFYRSFMRKAFSSVGMNIYI